MSMEAGNRISTGTPENGQKIDTHVLTSIEMSNLHTRLFNSIASNNGISGTNGGNLLISPLILEASLALLYLGSDGTTAEQLQSLLHLNKRFANNAKMANYYSTQLAAATQVDGNAVDVAASGAMSTHVDLCSRILLPENYKISDEFDKIAQKYFYTKTTKATMEAIVESIAAIRGKDYATKTLNVCSILLVTANFHNKWFLPFSAYRTGMYDFHVNVMSSADTNSGNEENEMQSKVTTVGEEKLCQQYSKPVAMLFDDDMFVKFAEFRELDARAIELPYDEWSNEDDELSMLLVLPNKRDGLEELLAQLCQTNLQSLAERMQMESVQVLLPRFEIDFECSLKQCLEQLGISAVFDENANFKNLLDENCQEKLHFENFIHKCSIAVNESGSEVAKVNGALKPIVISNSLNGGKKFFRADHPFFFVVRSSDAIYFMGQVTTF